MNLLAVQESVTNNDLISICCFEKRCISFQILRVSLPKNFPSQEHSRYIHNCSIVMRSPSIIIVIIILSFLLLSVFLFIVVFWYWYWYWSQALNAGYEAACPPCIASSSLILSLERWKKCAWTCPTGKQLGCFFSLCVVTAKDLCFKVILFLHMRGQWHWERFMACFWLLKASLASWSKVPFRSGWTWEKTSKIS